MPQFPEHLVSFNVARLPKALRVHVVMVTSGHILEVSGSEIGSETSCREAS